MRAWMMMVLLWLLWPVAMVWWLVDGAVRQKEQR